MCLLPSSTVVAIESKEEDGITSPGKSSTLSWCCCCGLVFKNAIENEISQMIGRSSFNLKKIQFFYKLSFKINHKTHLILKFYKKIYS